MKISDRILLGAVAGLGGNLAKLSIDEISNLLNLSELGGPTRAAGMLVPAHKVAEPGGKAVGWIADALIAGLAGVGMTYLLSITGKKHAIIKGALTGEAMWTTMYGVLGTAGATTINPISPKTVLTNFLSHSAYGALGAALVAHLGDPGLFDGAIPLSHCPIGPEKGESGGSDASSSSGQGRRVSGRLSQDMNSTW